MAPGTISKFGPPMFEPEYFPKQMCCIEESTGDILGPFRRPTQWVGAPMVIGGPGNCAPLAPPHYALTQAFINCKAASTPHPYLRHDVGRVTPAPLSIMTKLVVLWHAIARRSDIVTEQERSLVISTRPRPSYVIRKDKSICTAAFQARRY